LIKEGDHVLISALKKRDITKFKAFFKRTGFKKAGLNIYKNSIFPCFFINFTVFCLFRLDVGKCPAFLISKVERHPFLLISNFQDQTEGD
jgi:hypothetical protein